MISLETFNSENKLSRFESDWRESDLLFRQNGGVSNDSANSNWFVLMELNDPKKQYLILTSFIGESPIQIIRKHGGRMIRRSRTAEPLQKMAEKLRSVSNVLND